MPAETSHIVVDGGELVQEAGNIYLQADSQIEFSRVDNRANNQQLDAIIYPNSDAFVQTGQYAVGGVTLSLQEDANISLTIQGVCAAVQYVGEGEVSFSFVSALKAIHVNMNSLAATVPQSLLGSKVIINATAREVVGSAAAIVYDDALAYP